jgi:SOS-response transcriptional repressor LexA
VNELTELQEEAIEMIRDHVESKSRFPTYGFMMHALRYTSPNSITQILRSLERKGLIKNLGRKWVLVTDCCPTCGAKIEAEKSLLTNASPCA